MIAPPAPAPPALSVLYADAHLVVIDKPPAMAMHRSKLVGREGPFLVPALRDQLGQKVYPVHRLDRATRGALIVALSPEVHRALQGQFARREVHKRYEAIVRGWPRAHEQHIDRPLKAPEQTEARAARTTVRCLGTASLPIPLGAFESVRYAWVQALPETGRFHQIRRHLAGVNHPIVGDVNHGDRHHNHLWQRLGVPGLLLTARWVGFEHPVTGARVEVQAPRGAAIDAALHQLGLAPSAAGAPT